MKLLARVEWDKTIQSLDKADNAIVGSKAELLTLFKGQTTIHGRGLIWVYINHSIKTTQDLRQEFNEKNSLRH